MSLAEKISSLREQRGDTIHFQQGDDTTSITSVDFREAPAHLGGGLLATVTSAFSGGDSKCICFDKSGEPVIAIKNNGEVSPQDLIGDLSDIVDTLSEPPENIRILEAS